MPEAIPSILKFTADRGYPPFTQGDFNLNLIGIRSAERRAGTFDDLIAVAFKSGKGWVEHRWPATTDPGREYLLDPLDPAKGTAIVVPGRYRGLWKRGLHQGRYSALVQAAPVKVYRDRGRDDTLGAAGRPLGELPVEEGFFGINLHSTKPGRKRSNVEKFSAGCQVLKLWEDLQELLRICAFAEDFWGPKFTYTLIELQPGEVLP